MRKKGDLDEERQRDLSEGWAAANSVLIRANDAVDKEQRQQALGELQSRVEDWKGHKIEHFGDLLLYGDFTVLKGDGVKEVEREVRIIFDALDPKCRALIRRAIPHIPALVHRHHSIEVQALEHERQLLERRKLPFGLDVVPEEKSDEEAPRVSFTGATDCKLHEAPHAILKSHEGNQDPGEEKLRGLHKSPMKSFSSKSKASPSSKTESLHGPNTSQSHEKEATSSKLRSSLTSLFSKSRSNPSLDADSPIGPDIPHSQNGEKAQRELRSSHKGVMKSSFSKTKTMPSPKTDSPRKPDTPKSHDKKEAMQKLRGPHSGPMKSFLAKLSATPSPKLKLPETPGTTWSGSGLSNKSHMTIQGSGEGSGSAAGLTPATPSRKSRSFIFGALAKFGHKFRRKIRIPQIKSPAKAFEGIRTRVLMAAEFIYYFAFNGPLCNRTTFLNFENSRLPGVSVFNKDGLGKHGNKDGEANEWGPMAPVSMQYKVYLFERILLCCKEINPNKQKNKMLGNNKSLIDKKGKPRLQLKGRIFMQNVTDVMSISKAGKHLLTQKQDRFMSVTTFTDAVLLNAGSYSIQIFWRGDPGVENFVVKFSSEEVMNRWRSQVEAQKKVLSDSARRSSHAGTSETEFTYMRGQGAILQNPYQQEEDADDDFEEAGAQAAAAMGAPLEFTMNPNASSTSLRSRSTTGGSGPPTSQHQGRAPPPRFPVLENGHGPSLTLHTNVPPSMSPAELPAASSYFSPTVESPVSTRSSSQASMYPFPRQGTPGNGWVSDESKHNTAPAAVRAPSRDGQASPNCFVINGRTVQRPSLPAIASHISQNAQQLQLNMAQSRMRSASSPDMQQIIPGTRRYANGQIQCTSETVPVPPIPPHMAQMRAPLNRSQSNSPTNAQLPFRSATQSPNLQRDGAPRYAGQHVHDGPPQPQAIRHEARPYLPTTQTSPAPFFSPEHRLMSPPLPTATLSDEIPYPSQLKVKIWFSPHPSHVTIVVPIIIKHRSLIDRIDSKMEKISRASISRGTARLRYKDADGDSVLIGSDEDVQLAIEDWGLAHREELRAGNIADFELVWQET